jgi:hypothetical protein
LTAIRCNEDSHPTRGILGEDGYLLFDQVIPFLIHTVFEMKQKLMP